MLTYFVAYLVPSSNTVGNVEITRADPIDSYAKVGEIEQAIYQNLSERRPTIAGWPVVTNWILLSDTRT